MESGKSGKRGPYKLRKVPPKGHITKYGYRLIYYQGTARLEHTVIVEKALGKPFPKGAYVHHVNGNGLDNRPENLVLCSPAYHKLLHRRTAAMEITGTCRAQQCGHCQYWVIPEEAPPQTWCIVKGMGKPYRLSRFCALRGLDVPKQSKGLKPLSPFDLENS